MSIDVLLRDGTSAVLTTEHSASSYGQPVLVIDGEVFGPGDKPEELRSDLIDRWNAAVRRLQGGRE